MLESARCEALRRPLRPWLVIFPPPARLLSLLANAMCLWRIGNRIASLTTFSSKGVTVWRYIKFNLVNASGFAVAEADEDLQNWWIGNASMARLTDRVEHGWGNTCSAPEARSEKPG